MRRMDRILQFGIKHFQFRKNTSVLRNIFVISLVACFVFLQLFDVDAAFLCGMYSLSAIFFNSAVGDIFEGIRGYRKSSDWRKSIPSFFIAMVSVLVALFLCYLIYRYDEIVIPAGG